MTISLIIPTYNRDASLKRALESALSLDYPPGRYEIIVVDNGSADGTADVVSEAQSKSRQHSVRYIREERLGLHNARHAGVWAARGEILVFTDDDASFDANWLSAYADAFDAHPEMAAAGGPVRPLWETPPPEWLLEFIRAPKNLGMFSLMEPEDNIRLTSDGMFFGVNMAIRRRILIELGGFNPDSFGDTWLGDGETGLVYKLWEHKMLIGHLPGALAYHHIPPARMTLDYLGRRSANQGICDLYSEFHRYRPRTASVLKRAVRLAITHAHSWLRALLLKDRTDVRSLDIQLGAARTQAQLKYMLTVALDKDFQTFVAKKNWLNDVCPLQDASTAQSEKQSSTPIDGSCGGP